MIALASPRLRATVNPAQGGSINSLVCQVQGNWVPILQAAPPAEQTYPAMMSGLFLMLPFANRAVRNCLSAGGTTFTVLPNTAEPLALHGTGWERAWQVRDQTPQSLRLTLTVPASTYAFPFAAELHFDLSETALNLRSRLTNTGTHAIPAGIGFHPWFPRSPGTRLRFVADRFWLEGPDHLPTSPISIPPELDFAQPAALPATWRNNLYSGWSGQAEIMQPDLGYRLRVKASDRLDNLMLYTPPGVSRFALEPQSHSTGFTMAAELAAPAKGLDCLAPGDSLNVALSMTVEPM